MPKTSGGTYAGTFPYSNTGGIHGGGYCGGMSTIADDGTIGVTTDCGGIGGFREGGSDTFKQILRFGDNIPASESVFKGESEFYYGVDLCASTPTVRATTRFGRLFRTLNGGQAGEAWTRVSGYNSGNYDTTLTWRPDADARYHGEYLRIDPVNPDIVLLGHPINGAFLSANFTTTATFAQPASLPTPLNTGSERYGTQFAFDRSTASGGKCQTVYAFVAGRGIYRSTTGADGTFTQISDTITKIRDMQAVGGRLYVTDFTTVVADNGRIRWYDGGTWSVASDSYVATTIAVKPDNKLYAGGLRTGGGIHHTTDGGTSWTTTDLAFSMNATRDPWLGTANTGYLSPGTLRWEVRTGVNRWWVSTGVGVAYFDNPPRTSSGQKWTHAAHGIQQLILMNGMFASDGTFHVAGQDKAHWRFLPGKLNTEPTQVWDATAPLVQANDVATSPANPNLVVMTVRLGAGGSPIPGLWKSTQGGAPGTWSGVTGAGTTDQNGNIAMSSDTNWVWAPTSNAAVRYTANGGTSFTNSNFRATEGGAVIDMSLARIHNVYTDRRKILVPVEGQTGHFLIYVAGHPVHDGAAPDLLVRGVYKSTDGGANFIRTRNSRFTGNSNVDYYNGHIVTVPDQPNHYFWAAGAAGGPANPSGGSLPSGESVYFSSDQLVTTTALPGFQEAESIAVGAKLSTSQAYGTLYVSGWRQVSSVWTLGIWISTNFDPANLATATWTLDEDLPCGRDDFDRFLFADPKVPGRLIVGLPAGGYAVREYNFAAKAV